MPPLLGGGPGGAGVRGRRLLWLTLPLAVLGLDWGSKLWVLARLHPGEMQPVIQASST